MEIENAQVPEVGADGFLKTDTAPEVASETVEAKPPGKRRGRPPNSAKLEAEKPGASAKSATPKPTKRGAKMTQEQTSLFAKQLAGLHMMAASITGRPVLQLGDAESMALAQAIGGFAEEYGLSIEGKTGAALQLAGTMAMVYVPRLMIMRQQDAAARAGGVTDATVVSPA